MLIFKNVPSVKTEITTYTVGEQIKFWDSTERTWVKGKIIEITECCGYFVKLTIAYYAYKKQREVVICREDWLSKS